MAKTFGGALPSTASGGANATKAVSLTGNQKLDGILTEVAWGGKSIDYSFPTTKSVYGYTQQTDLTQGFFKTTLGQQQAARFALDADTGLHAAASAGFSVEGFTNLGVNYDATPDTDQIRLANTTSSWLATAEVADFPGNYVTSETQDNGDVWFGTGYRGTIYDYAKPVAGNYAWHTHLHEIGHALGLKHGNENSLAGPLPSNVDSIEFSVMTYCGYIGDDANGYQYENWGAPQTYMMLDIAALQHMYGADFTTNSGNTVYSWTPGNGNTLVNGVAAITPGGNRIFATVWDGGGSDTYDLSAYKTNLKIDLNAGGYSTFSAGQLADLGGGPNAGYARGNIFNALQYNGDARSLIENAIGGSGNDTILGNQAKNVLTGNGGKDTLDGAAGNDVLVGGAGSDVLIGGRGNDTLRLQGGVRFAGRRELRCPEGRGRGGGVRPAGRRWRRPHRRVGDRREQQPGRQPGVHLRRHRRGAPAMRQCRDCHRDPRQYRREQRGGVPAQHPGRRKRDGRGVPGDGLHPLS